VPCKSGPSATAIVGSVGRPPASFRGSAPVSGNRPCRFAENPPASGPGVFNRSMSFRRVVASRSFQIVRFLRVCGVARKRPRRPRPTRRLGDSRDHREVGHPGNRSAAQAPADRSRSRGRTPSIRGGSRRANRGLTPACWRFFFCRLLVAADQPADSSQGRLARPRWGREQGCGPCFGCLPGFLFATEACLARSSIRKAEARLAGGLP
jgi:hypothetical protein